MSFYELGGNVLNYNHKEIEKKWQNYWEENKTFKTNDNLGQKKFYASRHSASGAGKKAHR